MEGPGEDEETAVGIWSDGTVVSAEAAINGEY
jgi:hypothetical protein